MAEDTDGLRALYAEGMERKAGAHVSEADWERLALGQTDAAGRRDLFDHVTRCGPCSRVYRALRLLEDEAPEADRKAHQLARPGPASFKKLHRWTFGGGLAAAAAVLLWFAVRPVQAPPTPVAPEAEVVRGGTERPVPLSPTGEIAAPAGEFRWRAGAQPARYRVQLLDANGEPLFSSDLVDGSRLSWPESVTLAPGRYYWQVVASPSGDRQAELLASPLVSFEYAPAAR